MNPIEKRFYILPFICVIIETNHLSQDAKKTFGIYWEKYIVLKIGWFKWEIEVELYYK